MQEETANSHLANCPEFDGLQPLSSTEIAAVVVSYNIISVLALIGNGCVIFLIARFKRMRSPSNYFIFNLAVADIFSAIFCVQFSYWPSLILLYWPFGEFLCKLILFIQPMTICVSAYTLVAISVERFIAIMLPLRPRTTKVQALKVILVVWFCAVVTASPMLVVSELSDLTFYEEQPASISENIAGSVLAQRERAIFGGNHSTSNSGSPAFLPSTTAKMPWCDENWKHEYEFSQAAIVLQYFLPLTVLVATYTGIGLKIWNSASPGERADVAKRYKRSLARPLILIMFTVSVVYAVCWLPLNLLNVLRTMCQSYNDHPHILRIWWVCHIVAMSHSVFSPIVYTLTDCNFREGFKYIFGTLPCVTQKSDFHAHRQYLVPLISPQNTVKKLVRAQHNIIGGNLEKIVESASPQENGGQATTKLLSLDIQPQRKITKNGGSEIVL